MSQIIDPKIRAALQVAKRVYVQNPSTLTDDMFASYIRTACETFDVPSDGQIWNDVASISMGMLLFSEKVEETHGVKHIRALADAATRDEQVYDLLLAVAQAALRAGAEKLAEIDRKS